MTSLIPNANQRQVLQRLRTDHWRSIAALKISVGYRLLERLLVNGWVERRDGGGVIELKLTSAGSEALKMPIPTAVAPRKPPAGPPEANHVVVTTLALPATLCSEVDVWASGRALTREAALRQLVELGLKMKK